MDAAVARDFAYIHFVDLKKAFFDEVRVPGGTFTVGAVKQDRRAESKEAPRQATIESFYIDRNLVTNALYGAFLADTDAPRSAYPAYWKNLDYNGPDQPVIGVSLEDANRFAAWVSKRLGGKVRLPTEEEWEKAARGDAEVIYPWGDQSPTDSVRANYNGNGRFDGTSPVGSFENGKNAFGLYDMAGNVWEWTSTPSDSPDAPGAAIAKGGSWMDGPNELRVSNRRDLDPARRFSDVGFRLVREVSND
jgi:formylglycine-generating enzyme required for sulfatase activity